MGAEKVRIGVIGAGGRGRPSHYVFEPGVGGVITALCDGSQPYVVPELDPVIAAHFA